MSQGILNRIQQFDDEFNFVKPFTEVFKIYLFKKRQRVKMTIRVTDTFGTTYYWDQEVFEEMLENWENDWNGKARGIDVFIGPKKTGDKGTLKKKFVRMSFSGRAGFEHIVSRRDMIALKEEYNRQKNNPMPWDRKED